MAIKGTQRVSRELYLGVQKARKAIARGITKTLQEIRATEVAEMRRVFNRPSNYVLGAARIQAAEANGITGRAYLATPAGYKQHPITPQVVGGSRPTKRFERSLIAKGVMPAGHFAVPTRQALNGDGKMRPGLVQQVLAQAAIAQKTSGGLGVPDRSKKTLRRQLQARGRAGGQFVFVKIKKGKLSPGIYLVSGEYLGKEGGYRRTGALTPLFRYVLRVNYKIRLPFEEIGERIASQRLVKNIESSLAGANLLR